MSTPQDGGPAFPVVMESPGFHTEPGMSLRDWLAAHASEEDIKQHRQTKSDTYGYKFFSDTREKARYRYADAMIKERAKSA